MEFYQRTPQEKNPEWMNFLETLAHQIAIAIDHAYLVEDLQKSNLELTLAYDTTLEGWAKALELRDKEWQVMKQHTTYAYQWLSSIAFLHPALDIPYYHHERWDGNGYPNGLKGVQIPLPARIFSIVDVWDALLSDRPYREAWNRERAIEYIQEQSGKQFDPQVVECFLHLIAENQTPQSRK